ncbi:MAG: DUF4179 domain-containing protein [Bacillota bacterium]
MNCADVRVFLEEYIFGDLNPEAAVLVKQHLASCPACREEEQALARAMALLRRHRPSVPGDLWPSLRQVVAAAGGRTQARVRWIAAVAASLLLLFSIPFFSPGAMSYAARIPVIGAFYRMVGDPGMRAAGERGYGEDVNIAATDQGVTVTVTRVVADETRTVVYLDLRAKGTADEDFPEAVLLQEFTLKDSAGREYRPRSGEYGLAPGGGRYGIQVFEPLNAFPAEVTLLITQLELDGATLNGCWELRFPVNKIPDDASVLDVNESVTHAGITLTVDRLTLAPTQTVIYYTLTGLNDKEDGGGTNFSRISGPGCPGQRNPMRLDPFDYILVEQPGGRPLRVMSGGLKSSGEVWNGQVSFEPVSPESTGLTFRVNVGDSPAPDGLLVTVPLNGGTVHQEFRRSRVLVEQPPSVNGRYVVEVSVWGDDLTKDVDWFLRDEKGVVYRPVSRRLDIPIEFQTLAPGAPTFKIHLEFPAVPSGGECLLYPKDLKDADSWEWQVNIPIIDP